MDVVIDHSVVKSGFPVSVSFKGNKDNKGSVCVPVSVSFKGNKESCFLYCPRTPSTYKTILVHFDRFPISLLSFGGLELFLISDTPANILSNEFINISITGNGSNWKL